MQIILWSLQPLPSGKREDRAAKLEPFALLQAIDGVQEPWTSTTPAWT